MSAQRRQPPGQPIGGQFAAGARGESSISLRETPITADQHGEHRTDFENGYLSVQMRPSEYGTFTTVRTGGEGTGSAVLITNTRGEVLLVRQNRYAVDAATWEIPRGGSNQGEDLSETAQREVMEETGIELPLESIHSLGKVYPDSGLLQTEAGLFIARADDADGTPDNVEIQERVWVPADDLVEACVNGDVKCSFTVMSVLRARLRGLI